MTLNTSRAPARSARGRRRRAWAASFALVISGLIGGCAGIDPDPNGLVAAPSTAAGNDGLRRDRPWTAAELKSDFDEFAAKLPGTVAVAWAAVGSRHATQSLGGIEDQDAWSTAKVPLGVARLRLAGGKFNEKTTEVLRDAITKSDNAAAKILWRGLGTPEEAVALMAKVARDTGDEVTTFSTAAFGRSTWTPANQAQFAAGLPCIPDGPTVLDLMDEIEKEHRWGLANASVPVQFKGGWGIGSHGLLVRQLGVLALGDGKQVGVAIATMPATKDMTVGTSNLDALTRWLGERLGPADGGSCG